MGLAAIGKFALERSAPLRLGADDRRLPRRGDRLAGLSAALERNARRGRETGQFSARRPAIRHPPSNLLTEIIGTFILVLGALAIPSPKNLSVELGFSDGAGAAAGWFARLVHVASPWADRPVMRSIQPVTLDRASPILYCRSRQGNSDWRYAWIPSLVRWWVELSGAVYKLSGRLRAMSQSILSRRCNTSSH